MAELILEFFKTDTIADSDTITLINLAEDCIDDKGSAVLLARSLCTTAGLSYILPTDCGNTGTPERQQLFAVDNVEKAVTVYPNPAEDILQVITKYTNQHYSIFNIFGQMIVQGNLNGSELNISQVVPGAYFINLEQDGKTLKFIKQ